MNVISTRSIEIAAGMAADPAVRPVVKEWMRRAAERHIRKSPEMLEKIVSRHQIEDEVARNSRSKQWRLSKAKSRELVDKLSAQLEVGTEFYVFDFNRNAAFQDFLEEARSVLDWLDAIPRSDRHLKRIDRVSYREAAGISADWHRRLVELTTNSNDVTEEIDVIESFDDGCRFVELKGAIALLREGSCMNHCVGGRGYVEAVKNGSTRIFSLRDPSNRPHVTIEVRRTYRRKAFCAVQIKGKGNAAPALNGSWAAYCRAFVISQGWEVTRDGNLIGLYTIGGRTFDDPDEMLGALLDQVDAERLGALRGGSLSRVLGDAGIAGVILRNVDRLKDGTRRRLLKVLTPDQEPAFQTELVMVHEHGPNARNIEVRTLAMPSALMEALASGFFFGIEGEASSAIGPYLDKAVAEMKAEPHHVHKLEMGGLPKGADLLQQVMAYCGLTKKLDDVRTSVLSARNKVVGELSSAIRRAARSGETPPPAVGDWARQLAHLELVSRPAVEKMTLDSRHLVI
ncbi:hypothetical protein ACVIGB_000125 [Bradyrhizobium sp. USDA 4341]